MIVLTQNKLVFGSDLVLALTLPCTLLTINLGNTTSPLPVRMDLSCDTDNLDHQSPMVVQDDCNTDEGNSPLSDENPGERMDITLDKKVQPRKKSINNDFQSKMGELDQIKAKNAKITAIKMAKINDSSDFQLKNGKVTKQGNQIRRLKTAAEKYLSVNFLSSCWDGLAM